MCGLVTGINLLKQGQRVAIISQGQSALHFSSGSMGLLGYSNGTAIEADPLSAIATLPAEHPYSKVGLDNIKRYLPQVQPLFAEAGVTLNGDATTNHYRLTPLGLLKPAWLTMEGYATLPAADAKTWGKTLLVNLQGFLDFYPKYLAAGLEKLGATTVVRTITLDSLARLRQSPTEMRSTNIARTLDASGPDSVAAQINAYVDETGAETVLMPAVAGLFDETPLKALIAKIKVPLRFVSTIPMSVGGMRAQMLLRNLFHTLGGSYLLGDTVTSAVIEGSRVKHIYTHNLGDTPVEADNFVLASGSFLSHGIEANPQGVFEPIMGLDVTADNGRDKWCNPDIFAQQNFESYGVATDADLHPLRGGQPLANLYAAGAVVGGCNALKEESGAGITLMTAFKVAEQILTSKS